MVQGRRNPAHVGFPSRLKRARLDSELPKTALSLDAGLANNAIANLEAGARVPGIDTIERLARTLGVSICWLAFGIEQAHAPDDEPSCASMGQRLRLARDRAALSARALAVTAEISAPTVLRIEKGLFFPRLDTAESLSRALRVSACWLTFGIGPQELPPRRKVRTAQPDARD